MKSRIILLFISGVCLITNAKAQLNFTSVQEVWDYAAKHNIQLQAAEAGKSTAGIHIKQSYGALLPTVTANGSFTDNLTIQPTLIPANLFNPTAPAGTFTEATFGRQYIYNGNVAAQFDILNTQDWFNVKTAKLSNEIASLNIAKAKADLYAQLSNTYYTYILLAEAERLSVQNVQTANTAYQLASNKFKEGLISEATVNAALINKEKAEKSLDVAVQNKLLQLNNLKLLLNTTESITLTEQPEKSNNITLANEFATDPNVQLSAMQMQMAKSQWQSSKAAFVPTLSAVYQYNTQIAGDEFLKFSNTSNLPQQYWGLRLSIPIFSGGSRNYQVQKSKIDYNLKQKEYDNAKLQSGINDQNLLIAYNSSLNAFNKSKKILALYQSNDAHAERKLSEGIISLDDRLKVYTDLIANENEYLQSLSDYLIQQYRLQIRQTNFIQ